MMKRAILLTLLLAGALVAPAVRAAPAPTVTVRGPRLTVTFDHTLHKRIQWSGARAGAAGSMLTSDPLADQAIEVAGWPITHFALDPKRSFARREAHREFGAAAHLSVTGTAEEANKGVRLERTTRMWLPDRFPDVIIAQTRYKNTGATPLHLDRVIAERVLLDRRLAEPQARSWDLASFQGGAYKWGKNYEVIRLEPDFAQSNFQGTGDVRGKEGVGGGMPFVDVWGPTMGVALMHLEKQPEWLSLPVEVQRDGRVSVALTESPLAKFHQPEWLAPGASFEGVTTAMILHRGDSFDPLRVYGELLRARGIAIAKSSPAHAHEPYFKTWGFQKNFTLDKILATLPTLTSMGIRVMNLDDGWYDFMGDWNVSRAPGKFARGDDDMIAFVRTLHERGFKSSLWWYPLGVEPASALAKNHADLLVRDEQGQLPLDPNDLFQLCPAHPPALQHIDQVLRRVITKYGFDGVYSDFVGLGSMPPCFNPAHRHASPLDSFRALPQLFARIDRTLRELTKQPLHEVCICALPHSPYNMPYYNVASSSDPRDLLQARRRIKVEKAIRGGNFAVGDGLQVPIHQWNQVSLPEALESGIGTGAQLTTFFSSLDEKQTASWRRWFNEYKTLNLSQGGEYLNLYDLVWDSPEVHAVRKGSAYYYGAFAAAWPVGKGIALRGLQPGKIYEVRDYGNDRALGTVTVKPGEDPVIRVGFRDHLLLRARPLQKRP